MTATGLPKLCINCVHHRSRAVDNPDGWSRNIKCAHPTNVTDKISLVTGDQILYIYNTEELRNNHTLRDLGWKVCGPDGIYFEPRIEYVYLREPDAPAVRVKNSDMLSKL